MGASVRSIGLTAALLLLAATLPICAQYASASLSGSVIDTSESAIPKAKVALTHEATQTIRETETNASGVFSFTGLPPGTYSLRASHPGFRNAEAGNIMLTQGANAALPAITLSVESSRQELLIEASGAGAVITDNGQSSQTLNTRMIEDLSIVGRNAAELLKIMPGMGMATGLGQNMWNSYVTSSNNGPIGSFTANGTQPSGPLTLAMDGGNLIDPGCQCVQTANINQNQIQEVTILTSAYGAEFANGPVIFQAIGKSGGSHFHGQAYFYARNGVLNSNDSYLKSQGVPQVGDSFYYPGGDFGGPVILPKLDFNRNRDKLFFYSAFEYMVQHPPASLMQYFVPTTEMKQGNFSRAYLDSLGPGFAATRSAANVVPGGNAGAGNFPGGIIPLSQTDPNSAAYMSLFPQPNTDPAANAAGANYQYFLHPPQNRWEFRIRGDYNISERTRLFFSWNRQQELQENPISIWWSITGSLPYPSSQNAVMRSNVYSANLVHVFSPTLTNEFVFSDATFINPIVLGDPAAVDPARIGFHMTGFFANPFLPQIPNTYGYSDAAIGFATYPYGAPWPAGGANSFGKLSQAPNISDNLTKVLSTHTLKAGFYWSYARNNQTTGGLSDSTQGGADFENWGATSTGNPLADWVTGRITQFSQMQNAPVTDMRYFQYSGYVSDQWKVTRRLTVNAGLRFEHLGNWVPAGGPGLAVWDQSKYDNTAGAGPWTGVQWNAINSAVPMSGFPSRSMFFDPRVGAAYDLFGNGRTVLRGGWGRYRYQLSFNSVTQAAYSTPLNISDLTTTWGCCVGWNQFNQYSPATGVAGLGSGIVGILAKGDDRTPYTDTFNVTISQRAPWHSVAEFQYSGNRSRDLLLNGQLNNINKVPVGAFFGPNPVDGKIYDPSSGDFPAQDYRPLLNYQDVTLNGHGSYSNYNAFIASWQKQTGRVVFTLNYTFSKVLGIRDSQSDNLGTAGTTLYPYGLAQNYGVLSGDHTHIFNAAYVVNLPGLATKNRFARTAVNGWILSGVTQWQSGAPIQPNTSGSLWAQWPQDFTGQIYLGTNAMGIFPKLTCDPRSGLSAGQYFNPNCFAPPAGGANGDIIWPYIRGPAYFNSDLALYKNFKVGEHQRLQFRFSAFNFLNHPLPQFGAGSGADVSLSFVDTNGALSKTNVNPYASGKPMYTVGRRVVELAVKYNF